MATSIGWASLQIMPTLTGVANAITSQVQGPIQQAGQASGQDFGDAMAQGVKKAEAAVVSATRKLAAARDKEADSQGKLNIAQAKLNELQDQGVTSGSRYVAAVEALERAKRSHNKVSGAAEAAEVQLRNANDAVTDAMYAEADAVTELSTAHDQLSKSSESASKAGDALHSGLGKIGGITAGAVAGVMGVGAAIDGIGTAIEKNDINSKLKVQLGLTAQEAGAAGAVAGDLYYKGFGENYEQVNEAVAAVGSTIADFGTSSQEDIEKLTTSAMNMSEVFGVDVAESTAVAGQLIKDGLAGDATTAMDLMVGAMQQVPVAMQGEIFPVFSEYSKHFAGLGLEGEQAFGLVVAAAQDGAIGMDKIGDGLKEFQIRATDMSEGTKEAFQSAGVNMEKMTADLLAGGPAAGAAFNEIVAGLQDIQDPADQAAAALALFGSPLEDLGVNNIPQFLDQLGAGAEGMGEFEEAAHMMNEDMASGAGNAKEILERSMEGIYEALGPLMQPIAEVLGEVTKALGPMVEVLGGALADAVQALLPALPPLATTFGTLIEAIAPVLPVVAELVSGLIQALAPALTQIIEALMPVIQTVADALMPVFEQLAPILADVAGMIADALVTALDALAPYLPQLFEALGMVVQALLPLLPPLLELGMSLMPLLTGAIQILAPIIVQVSQIFAGIVGILADMLIPVISALTTVMTAIATFISDVFVGAFNLGKDAIDGVIAVFGWLKDKAGEVLGWVGDKITGFIGIVGDMGGKIKNAASGMWDGIKDAFKGAINWILTKWNEFKLEIGGQKISIAGLDIDIPTITLNTPDIPLLASGGVAGRTKSGLLWGPGTGRSDSILGIDAFGIPTARVSAGEGVVMESAMNGGGDQVVAALNAGWTPSAEFLHGLTRGEFRSNPFGIEEDSRFVAAALGARSLIADGDFTGNLHDAFGIEEDHPVVGSILGLRELIRSLPAYADGGAVVTPGELAEFAKPIEGQTYDFSGWGNGWITDCSGAVAALANFATGRLAAGTGQRFATGTEGQALAALGFKPGLGPAGSLQVGWYNGGPWGGHTAVTLPNGVNVEMGGNRGNGQYGGPAAGASWGPFTDHAHLPMISQEALGALQTKVTPYPTSPQVAGADVGASDPSSTPAGTAELQPEKAFSARDRWKTMFTDVASIWADSSIEMLGVGEYLDLADRYTIKTDDGTPVTPAPGSGVEGIDGDANAVPWLMDVRNFLSSVGLFDTGGVWEPGTFGFNGLTQPEYVLKDAHWKVAEANIEKVDELVGAGVGASRQVIFNNNQQVTIADQAAWQRDQAARQNIALMRFGGGRA